MNIGEIRTTSTPLPQTRQAPKSAASPDAAREKKDSLAVNHGTGEANEAFSAAETKFFESLFPQSAKEIRSYATYRKEGDPPPAVLGSIIDRKG
jgi:hypothetical protein